MGLQLQVPANIPRSARFSFGYPYTFYLLWDVILFNIFKILWNKGSLFQGSLTIYKYLWPDYYSVILNDFEVDFLRSFSYD